MCMYVLMLCVYAMYVLGYSMYCFAGTVCVYMVWYVVSGVVVLNGGGEG